MVTKIFKLGRRIMAYVEKESTGYKACTGKPSDVSGFSWGPFPNRDEAITIARKYMSNLSNGREYKEVDVLRYSWNVEG